VTTHVEAGTLAELADGTLSEAAAVQVRSHLSQCRSCMAAYADAVRYRAAWLAEPDGFSLDSGMRRLATDPADLARTAAGAARVHPVRRGVVLSVATATAVLAIWASVSRHSDQTPSLSFPLPPGIQEATERSSSTGLILPGAEAHANDVRPEQRAGSAPGSPELERELRSSIEAYEEGSRGPEAGATAVAALLAAGEIDAARDYARECLRRYPDDVRLLVLGADAHYRSSDLGGAEALLRSARKHAPRDPVVALDLALVLRQAGKGDESRAILEHVSRSRLAPLASRAKRELAQPARH